MCTRRRPCAERAARPTAGRTASAQCGRVDRWEHDDDSSPGCGCRAASDDDDAVITVLTADKDRIWHQLTDAKVADHVIARVISIMYGKEGQR